MDERVLSSSEGELVARLAQAAFCSVSAKSGEGLDSLFRTLTEKVFYRFVDVKEPVVTEEMIKMYTDRRNDYTAQDI